MYYDVSDENNATTEGSTQQKKDHTGFAINAYTSVRGCSQVTGREGILAADRIKNDVKLHAGVGEGINGLQVIRKGE